MTQNTGRLAGKTALITAAGQGIGRASAELFAAEGAKVIACDINAESLAELAEVDGITALTLDVTDASALARAIQDAGPLNVLFNCAGYVASGSILDCDENDWDFSFDLNVKAMYRLTKLVLPGMLENGGGSIINMSSVASSLKGVPNRFAYCASKAAVNQIVRGAAIELGRTHKDCICVALHPGTVATEFTRKYLGRHPAVEPEVAAARLVDVIEGLQPAQSGGFYDYAMKEIPW